MMIAIEEAKTAATVGEIPVGAVITHAETGKVIARTHNLTQANGNACAHAEILAISKAAQAIGDWRLNKCTLYVTREPCPMCSGALVIARIGKVYYGLPDSRMGCVGGALDLGALPNSNHRFQSVGGILEKLNHTLLNAFFELKRQNKITQKTIANKDNLLWSMHFKMTDLQIDTGDKPLLIIARFN